MSTPIIFLGKILKVKWLVSLKAIKTGFLHNILSWMLFPDFRAFCSARSSTVRRWTPYVCCLLERNSTKQEGPPPRGGARNVLKWYAPVLSGNAVPRACRVRPVPIYRHKREYRLDCINRLDFRNLHFTKPRKRRCQKEDVPSQPVKPAQSNTLMMRWINF